MPKKAHLQNLAWEHLLKGQSLIVIDDSDHLPALLYLPPICTKLLVCKLFTIFYVCEEKIDK